MTTSKQKIISSVAIHAPRERVWRTLLEDSTYRQWTGAFHEGSYAETDWKEGSGARFLTPERNGMFSRILAHRANELLSIRHLGVIKDGAEDTQSEHAKAWAGLEETYSIRESDGVSTLTVEMETSDGYRGYFEEAWPKALAKLKEIAEA
jgi:uncharacterized protein YndB with AHSA1/START domain